MLRYQTKLGKTKKKTKRTMKQSLSSRKKEFRHINMQRENGKPGRNLIKLKIETGNSEQTCLDFMFAKYTTVPSYIIMNG